jgi:hypothetical protein
MFVSAFPHATWASMADYESWRNVAGLYVLGTLIPQDGPPAIAYREVLKSRDVQGANPAVLVTMSDHTYTVEPVRVPDLVARPGASIKEPDPPAIGLPSLATPRIR